MPRRVTGCVCGVGVPLMYVSRRTGPGLGGDGRGGDGARRMGRGLGRGREGGTAHPNI